jgi:hypothetical protein
MIIRKFCIGKKKCYKGICIIFGWIKLERIGMGKNFLWRLEFSNWRDK